MLKNNNKKFVAFWPKMFHSPSPYADHLRWGLARIGPLAVTAKVTLSSARTGCTCRSLHSFQCCGRRCTLCKVSIERSLKPLKEALAADRRLRRITAERQLRTCMFAELLSSPRPASVPATALFGLSLELPECFY